MRNRTLLSWAGYRHWRLLLPALIIAFTLTACDWSVAFGDDPDEDDNDENLSPVTSQVTGFELGVSDLDMSLPVYRDGLGMEVVEEAETDTSVRVTLASPVSPFDATLTLIEFTDGLGRNLQDNPGKIVFFTSDATALANRFANAGGVVTLPPENQGEFGVVGFGRDPDRNLIEIAEASPTGATYLAAVGVGASDLDAAREFYEERVGLTERRFLSTERYDEYIMGTPEDRPSLSLVLMHWTDDSEPRYRYNETRVQLISEDPEEVVERTWSEEDGRTQDPDGNRLIIDEEPGDLAGTSAANDDSGGASL
ncbi:VOC family protein [Marinobacter sp.]|uniref:VOC family protein n=1 Tax=Marinobacter sp. TaxID=50741 RepID=UPI003565711A